MKLILDLDSLLYKAGFSVEKNIRTVCIDNEEVAQFQYVKDMKEWLANNDLEKSDVEIKSNKLIDTPEAAVKLLDILIHNIQDTFPNSELLMYAGGRSDFRYELYPEYKAKRAPKPTHYELLFSHAKARGCIVPKGLEADDAVSIKAHECLESGEDYVIASIDKDLAQIPGVHFNYNTEQIIEIDPITAALNFYTQLLVGDTSDNIPGVKGIGPVNAELVLDDANTPEEMYEVCREAWKDDEAMNVSAELLYLLQYDGDKWSPP